MNRVEFQLFLINSLISSLSVPVVLLGVTSRLFIEFSFLDFHIDHIVTDIRIRSLSESLVKSSLKDNALAPLTMPVVIAGHCLSVAFLQMYFAVSHAWDWPLFSQSIHMCCLSGFVMDRVGSSTERLQAEGAARRLAEALCRVLGI